MTPTIPDEAVQAAEEAVYVRHERGFLMKPLVDPIDMRAALTAILLIVYNFGLGLLSSYDEYTEAFGQAWRGSKP